jgi:hypothetical protein
MAKKIYAESAEMREQECDHPGGFPYRGAIPCTGPQVCYLCGTHKADAKINDMGIEEFETAQMFAAYLRDIIENDAAGAAHTLAENMADIFKKYAAEGGRVFDKAEFLRIVRAA